MTIGVVAATAAGRTAAAELRAAWPGEVRVFAAAALGGTRAALAEAWRTCDAVVSFLAVGATVRILAPLLGDKATDPAVVCVDEARRHAVALLGGHRGANELAERVAGVLGCRPVITTAADAAGQTPLDEFGADLGFTADNPAARAPVGAAVLNGEPVRLIGAEGWPLPPLPPNVAPPNVAPATSEPATGTPAIVISDLASSSPGAGGGPVLVLRPPSLVVGVGSARGVAADEVDALIDAALAAAGLHPRSVRCLATVDRKADERGIVEAAARRAVPLETFPADLLAAVDVPNPSEIVRAEVGTPSVAEAAALHAAGSHGRGAELIVEKRTSAHATVAVARLRPRGRLSIIGIGPGARDLLTPRAVAALRRAAVVVGLDQYVDQVRDLLRPGTRVLRSGLGREEERARTAVAAAAAGQAVALVGSGDAGVYALAGPALELAGADIEVAGVPGVTAALAAASTLGAPLAHDHAYISLSDLNTPWEIIEGRVRAAAEGDFTVCLYNPRSRTRTWQLSKALAILAAHRPARTPVGYVRNASRPDETVTITTIRDFDPDRIDMFTVVIVGSSRSHTVAGRFVTPRGYPWTSS
ncbi:MAG TPA: precorrin-3B C(17)-methyltransferase [Streptosporangiaceae bacterium]|nr:precorrin-3B C(17)-methyltransferase [Streptosporangiaceae bacterium]